MIALAGALLIVLGAIADRRALARRKAPETLRLINHRRTEHVVWTVAPAATECPRPPREALATLLAKSSEVRYVPARGMGITTARGVRRVKRSVPPATPAPLPRPSSRPAAIRFAGLPRSGSNEFPVEPTVVTPNRMHECGGTTIAFEREAETVAERRIRPNPMHERGETTIALEREAETVAERRIPPNPMHELEATTVAFEHEAETVTDVDELEEACTLVDFAS